MKRCKEFIKKHIELFLTVAKLLCFAIVLFISFGVILGVHTMDSDYMRPAIKFHDNVVYSRLGNDFALRDVVVYEHEGKTYIGRIVGMAGDTITTNSNGNVFQNGFLVYEEDIKYTSKRSMEVEVTLNEGQYFVICDDRSQNFDSRKFGVLSEDNIKGKVLIVLRRYGI